MKKIFSILTVLALIISSCEQQQDTTPATGSITFEFSTPTTARLQEFNPDAILVTIETESGETVHSLARIELYQLSDQFLSNSVLQVPVGNLKITQLLAVNEENEVTHVIPTEGSVYASSVEDPLPIYFEVSKDQRVEFNLQLIKLEGNSADYGYTGFVIEETNTLQEVTLNFSMLAPDYFVTEGYDSVRVTLTHEAMSISKLLTITSPTTATGSFTINWTTIQNTPNVTCQNCWTIKVQAYHEVIDDVLQVYHVNEIYSEEEVIITRTTTSLDINEGNLIVHAETPYSHSLALNMQSHFSDDSGYYRFTIDNDFCNTSISYDIYKPIVDLTYSKDLTVWLGEDNYDYLFSIKYNDEIGVGHYNENLDPLCSTYDINSNWGSLTWFIALDDLSYLYCYIVWESQIDPHDPPYTGRNSQTSTGYFKAVSKEEFETRKMRRK